MPSLLHDLDDMTQREVNDRLERLTGRVTALEKKRDTPSKARSNWNRGFMVAVGAFLANAIALPIMLLSWIDPHLQNDLKKDVTIEAAAQLKEPLKQLSGMSSDIAEIKGKLEVLDPLIREMALKRISEAGKLESKNLIAQSARLQDLARTVRTDKIEVKPETIETVGKKLVETHDPNAWGAAIDFLNYKSFLNVSLSVQVNSVIQNGTLNTNYNIKSPTGMAPPQISVVGAVPRQQAAQLLIIGQPDPNASAPLGNDWIIGNGGSVTLDGMEFRKVVFVNTNLFYAGGPLKMQDVYFLNCTFSISRQSNGERLVLAALEPSPATTFSTS